jgi:lysyl-tRNA synthetase class 1
MNLSNNIIGHGTWYDKVAHQLVKREKELSRSLEKIRVESGVAASGVPHIGSLAEITRNYAIALALKEQGYNTEFIVFSDNKDGLRKVPTGFPSKLNQYLGKPVTNIPDPFGCHKSFGDHMVGLLLESMDKLGVQYILKKADEVYRDGLLNEEIRILLENARQIGTIILEETGQTKFLEVLPYFPVCAICGKIYTTKAYEFIPKKNIVRYKCEGLEIKGKWLKGCGHNGKVDYTKGEGKLSWKAGELAARWRALDIRFEAYGKDLSDSVRVNDRISREIFGFEPPMHVQYEMFLDKGGKKISKSFGNVFSPQIWFKYGSAQSLLLLTLKRFAGTRNISVKDIPQYMKEIDELEDIYFGKKKIRDQKEKAKLTGLFEYCWFMNPPIEPSLHIPYNLLVHLAKVAPKETEINFIIEKLKDINYIKDKVKKELKIRIEYAINWTKDFKTITETTKQLNREEKKAIEQLIKKMQDSFDPDKIQSAVFETARKNDLVPGTFFKLLYSILLSAPSGPKLGPYIVAIGKENVTQILKKSLKFEKKISKKL